MTEWIGSKWLAATWHITPVQPFWIESQISSAPRTVVYDGLAEQVSSAIRAAFLA